MITVTYINPITKAVVKVAKYKTTKTARAAAHKLDAAYGCYLTRQATDAQGNWVFV